MSGLSSLHKWSVSLFAWALLLIVAGCEPTHALLELGANGDVTIGGQKWLSVTGEVAVYNGALLSTADGSLKEASRNEQKGADGIGAYRESSVTYTGAASVIITSTRIYADGETIVFEQRFPEGLARTGYPVSSESENMVTTEFPIITTAARDDLGALSFGGKFMEQSKAGPFEGASSVSLGCYGGPFALFDGNNTLVLSAASNFATASFAEKGEDIAFGVMGTVESLPKGFTISMLLSAGKAPTEAVKRYGAKLLALHSQSEKKSDFTTEYLGYATQNGAYYYYNPDGTYEKTILAVADYAREVKIPYRYVLLDSWWYEKGVKGGVKNWSCTESAFPSPGFCETTLEAETGWKTELHNRFWASDTVYARQNGGDYAFIIEGDLAIPTEQRFWDDLMRNKSGMVVYEQDWMYNEFQGLNATRRSATLTRDWLLQMGRAAERANVAVMYCMELARFVLQSVEIPAVTQFRASDDYNARNDQDCSFPYCVYYIGTTSLMGYALNLKPSKDDFWTTSSQPGNAYNNETVELHPRLHAVVAALSTGPIQPGDGVGFSDVGLIMRGVDPDGRILGPSRPASAIDACFYQAAGITNKGPIAALEHNYPVMSTHTVLNGMKWAHVLVVNLADDFTLLPSHLAPTDLDDDRENVVYTDNADITNFTTIKGLKLAACGMGDFQLYHTAPVLPNGWAYLGEMGAKWVPVSTARTTSLKYDDRSVTVQLRGAAYEPLDLFFRSPKGDVLKRTAMFDSAGDATLRVTLDEQGGAGMIV